MTETAITTNTLHAAAAALHARNLDWASEQNAVGFNKADSWLGSRLATIPEGEWTGEMKRAAWVMLRKYARQLASYGIDFAAIPEPPKVASDDSARQAARTQAWNRRGAERVRESGKIERVAGGFEVSFPYDADTVAKVKAIPGRSFDGRTKSWFIPETDAALAALGKFSRETGVEAADPETAEYLELAAAEHKELPAKRIERDASNGAVRIVFPYDPRLVSAVKATGARWDSRARVWTAKLSSSAAALAEFANKQNFHVPAELRESLAAAAEQAKERRVASTALHADVKIDGLGAILHPFQAAGVAYIENGEGVLVGDPMGLGKSPQALAAAQKMERFPFVVIVPNLAKRNWLGLIDFWLPERTFTILDTQKREITINRQRFSSSLRREYAAKLADSDTTAEMREQIEYALRWDDERRAHPKLTVTTNDLGADIIVINYDLIARKPGGRVAAALAERFPGKTFKRLVDALIALKPLAYTADESQYLKNPKAQRTQAAGALAAYVREHADERVWYLSGTHALNRPVELVPQLEHIGKLPAFGGFWGFVKRYTAAYNDGYGLNTSGASNLEELNERLRATCYIRREKSDVLSELPPVQRDSLEFPLANPRAYKAVSDDLLAWVRERAANDRDFLAEIADLDADEQALRIRQEKQSAAARAARAEILVKLNALRLVAAREKLPAVTEWVQEWLDGNPEDKIIVFAWHQEIQHALLRAFPGAAAIVAEDETGRSVRPEERSANEHRFQNDPDCRILVAGINVSGVSLTLTAAHTVAFAELPWRPGDIDQCEGRAYGRLNDAHGVNSYYLLGEDTIDADMAVLIDEKRAVLDMMLSGEVGASGEGIISALVGKLLSLDEEAA